MKAQNVKNTVIVPVGAKGGFVPKRPPIGGSREEIAADGVACYQTFIRGLLDVTDNIVNGRIVAPPRVVRRDGDDAYLVVAADKGTATFSDIANAISIEYGFWLGDAFASGGSAGYDHKKMGITARGAWECVKRLFREMGVNIQTQDFTCAGIGDMSGDVFGNGMLLSRHTKLQAAFNHQHIFLDPRRMPASSFSERERLFKLPRSTWDDYDRKLISRGGGIFSRSAKSITLSPAAQAMLGLDSATRAAQRRHPRILRMPVDLLWNGGIGTYVKASDESNAQVGDRTNDAVRLNGKELRAKVVGEGGNLGFSQRGRIEYALGGGRVNTDFIDNSGGVNTSDLEVNIKILLNPLIAVRQADARRAQQAAGPHDEGSGGAGAEEQLPAEPGDQHARAAVGGAPVGIPASHPLARAHRRSQSHAGIPADGRRVCRAAQGRSRPHAAGARDHARLQQDLAEQSSAGFGRAGRPISFFRARALFPRPGISSAFRAPFPSTGCVARSSPRPPRTAWSTAWVPRSWRARRKRPAAVLRRSPGPTRRPARSSTCARSGRRSRRSTTASPPNSSTR